MVSLPSLVSSLESILGRDVWIMPVQSWACVFVALPAELWVQSSLESRAINRFHLTEISVRSCVVLLFHIAQTYPPAFSSCIKTFSASLLHHSMHLLCLSLLSEHNYYGASP